MLGAVQLLGYSAERDLIPALLGPAWWEGERQTKNIQKNISASAVFCGKMKLVMGNGEVG